MRSFEDDPKLDDLLSPAHQAELLQLLGTLGGVNVELVDETDGTGEPLEFNLETLGWLRAKLPAPQRQAAARLFERVLFQAGKYRLAANLHHDAIDASYFELQQQHTALQASEARYKRLSEQLQQRVAEQVELIEQTQQQLYENARLLAVGQLAAGVAHEINTPIGFIGSNLRVADDYLDELEASLPVGDDTAMLFEDFRALLEESRSGAKRIASIVADLRTFSNIDQADFVACDLNALLTTTCHLLQAEHHQALPIELRLGELPRLAGYPAKLSQAFYNVLDNAAKALGADELIEVKSRVRDGMLEIEIEDNGCGMSEDVLARIFEPFFTTRGVGAGSGLGLSVARDIVVAHQGEMRIHSRPGQGTRVTLRFQAN